MQSIKKKLGDWFYLIPILLIGFGVYINSLPNKFVWDDEEMILNNPAIQSLSHIWSNFTSSAFFNSGGGVPLGGYYRPLPSFLYTIFWHWWGAEPTYFRLMQIFLHLIFLVLVFFTLKKLLYLNKIATTSKIAAISTLLFAVHPANVETVQYVADLGSVLYPLFALFSFYLLIIAPRPNRKMSVWLLALSALSIFIALLAQEGAIVMVVVAALYFTLFLRDRWFYLIHYVVMGLLSYGAYLYMRLNVANLGYSFQFPTILAQSGPVGRLLTFPYEAVSYLRLAFFPARLSIDNQFAVTRASDPRFWGSTIILLLIIGLVYLLIKKQAKWPLYLFLIGWFALILGPMLNIIPLDLSIAEHWMYLPLVGLITFVILLVTENKNKWPKLHQEFLPHILVIIIIILSVRTMVRNTNWRDGLTLYGHDIQYNLNNPSLENNFGVELFRIGKIDEAATHFRQSINFNAKWEVSLNNLGVIYERKGDLVKASELYLRSIEAGDYHLAYENMSTILIKQNKINEALQFTQGAVKKYPNNVNLLSSLAYLFYVTGDKSKASVLAQELFNLNINTALMRQIISDSK